MKKKLISLAICGVLSLTEGCFGMQYQHILGAVDAHIATLEANLANAQAHIMRLEANAQINPVQQEQIVNLEANLANAHDVNLERFDLRPFRASNTVSRNNPIVMYSVIDGIHTIAGSLLCEGVLGYDGVTSVISPANALGNINLSDSLSIFIDSVGHSNGAYAPATAGFAAADAYAAPGAPAPTAFVDVMAGTVTANSIASHYAAFAAAIGASDVDAAANFHIMAINAGQNATGRRVADLVAGLNAANLTQADSVATVVGADAKDVLLLGLLANAAIAEIGFPDGRNIGGAAPVALGYTPEILNNIRGILAELHV